MKFVIPLLLICGLAGVGGASAQSAPGRDFAVVVSVGSPYETLAELVQVGRAAEDGLKCGAGRGTPGCEAFARSTGIKVQTVLYKASGAVANDLGDNQLDFGVLTMEDAKPGVDKRRLRILK